MLVTTGPFLKTSDGKLLPINVNDLTNASGFVSDTQSLFLAGDVRANEQIGLTVIHTLFVREHNRIATLLRQQNRNQSSQEIFEASRRLVIGTIQKITYDEFLPALLGADSMPHYSSYNDKINPTIYNEFSVAAYRFGHSAINQSLLRLNSDGQSVSSGPLALRDGFFTGINLLLEESDLDPYLIGLATQGPSNN